MILLTLLYYICHIIIQERLVIMVFRFVHKRTLVYEEGTSATLESGILINTDEVLVMKN